VEGEGTTPYGDDAGFVIVFPEDGHGLMAARKRSRDGRAALTLKHRHGLSAFTIYWHVDGHCPEKADGTPAMAIGSEYWYWLLDQRRYHDSKMWSPTDPLTPLEVLAKAGTDDPVYFARTA
jgi:hypothetical protein